MQNSQEIEARKACLLVQLNDPSEDARRNAVVELSLLGDSSMLEVFQTLIDNVREEDEFVRREAVFGLENIQAFDELDAILCQPKYGDVVRSECAYALGRTGDPTFAETLISALDDSFAMVRKAAKQALVDSNMASGPRLDRLAVEGTRRQKRLARQLIGKPQR